MRSFNQRVRTAALAVFIGVLGLAAEVAAQVPRPNVYNGGNRWLITAFDDSSAVHQEWATQGVCFLPFFVQGTHIRGVWYSDTYPGWSGRYSQEGDLVLMHGNWGNDVGSDGMVIDLFAGTSPRDVGGGQWTEWFNAGPHGTTVGFLNARLTRVGRCRVPQNVDTLSQAELEKLAEELSRQVQPRLRRDGKAAESPTDPEQVPLPEEGGN